MALPDMNYSYSSKLKQLSKIWWNVNVAVAACDTLLRMGITVNNLLILLHVKK